jgi:hypothetical protein
MHRNAITASPAYALAECAHIRNGQAMIWEEKPSGVSAPEKLDQTQHDFACALLVFLLKRRRSPVKA